MAALIFQIHFLLVIFKAAFNEISYEKNVENVLGLCFALFFFYFFPKFICKSCLFL